FALPYIPSVPAACPPDAPGSPSGWPAARRQGSRGSDARIRTVEGLPLASVQPPVVEALNVREHPARHAAAPLLVGTERVPERGRELFEGRRLVQARDASVLHHGLSRHQDGVDG